MTSSICSGKVFHHRRGPKVNGFSYPDTQFLLDLAALESGASHEMKVCRRRVPRADHFGDSAVALDDAIRDLVNERLGIRPTGQILMLTHVRQVGYVMNPVSFFYCYSEDGLTVEAIVAEVHNTPWGERHCYVFKCEDGDSFTFRFKKDFHVSPFMEMDQEYVWTFTAPGDSIKVYMQNWEKEELIFEASLDLQVRPLTESSLRRFLWRSPFVSIAVIVRIYWQALKIWVKRVPYVVHPRKKLLKDGGQ
ncbi:MAG: DUF1365 domain-containing protein [Fimbriimonadaceae bacterium]